MARKLLNIALLTFGWLWIPATISGQSMGSQAGQPGPVAKLPPSSQSTQGAATDGSRPVPRQRNPRYKIQSDDILELSFRFTPEFDQEVTVQPDGFVQLKGISNDVHIQGLTVPETIGALKLAYANVLNQPEISVVLRDFEKPYFVAGGQVGKPGKYDLRGETSAAQAIQIAGGFVDFAKSKQVLLFRRYNDDTVEVKVLNIKDVLKKKDPREDVVLQPGDMLYVPKSALGVIDRFLPRSSLGTYFPVPM
jgi:polysaccharide biosynthesis/export protein